MGVGGKYDTFALALIANCQFFTHLRVRPEERPLQPPHLLPVPGGLLLPPRQAGPGLREGLGEATVLARELLDLGGGNSLVFSSLLGSLSVSIFYF